MGTLVQTDDESISKKDKDKAQAKLEKKLEKEYSKFRTQFEDVRQAYRELDEAKSHDDIYELLLNLEKTVKTLRKGGMLSNGSKSHRRLLQQYENSLID